MAGVMSTADKIRKRKRNTADALEAAIESRGRRRSATKPKKVKPSMSASDRAKTKRRARPTRAQKVRGVSKDNSARLAEIERRMKEIMGSATTPDRR